MQIEVPWGDAGAVVDFPEEAAVLDSCDPPAVDPTIACGEALADPVRAPPLHRVARRGDRVAILVPDATRDTPRAAQVAAVLDSLRGAGVASAAVVLVAATGAHAAGTAPRGGWGGEAAGLSLRVHDGRSDALGAAGRMSSVRGRFLEGFLGAELDRHRARVPGAALRLWAAATAGRARVLRLAPEVLDADLVVSLGAVLPHSIAGFAGGSKMIFPGVADARSIAENHALRMHPSVRRGRLEGNLAREHLEAGARLVRARRYVLDVLLRPGGGTLGAVAGDPEAAVREAAARLRPTLEVRAASLADTVVVIVAPPACRTVYQATKGVVAAAPILSAHGSVVVIASCEEGVGDLVGARRIVALGLRTTLPPGTRLVLASRADPDLVRRVGFEPSGDPQQAVREAARRSRRLVVLPRAVYVLPRRLELGA